ncbi:MAG: hypothetical protein A2289_03070 [Deltaproteobacteria bacterium RIFOXYA12_FULL_58_15]|nr:MAG: hypothetical protein A2289_03070 [Deltaproteobacteria bacterium RIFOXYA12_FULL_58_15]
MRQFLLGLSLSAAFIAGAVFSQTLSSSAQAARASRMKWEYFCVEKFSETPEKLVETFTQGGLKGWELAAAGEYTPAIVPTTGEGHYPLRPVVWCFKRPAE